MGSCGRTLASDPDPDADLGDLGEVVVLAVATTVHYMGGGSERASVMLREFRRAREGKGINDKAYKDE